MGIEHYFKIVRLEEELREMENSVDKLSRRLDQERQEFMEFVIALRRTFAASNGRIPFQHLDAFIKKTWPHMRLEEGRDVVGG